MEERNKMIESKLGLQQDRLCKYEEVEDFSKINFKMK